MPPKRKSAASKTAAGDAAVEEESHTQEVEETVPELPVASPGSPVPLAEAAAPGSPIVVSGSPTEIYGQLQTIVASEPSRVSEYVSALLVLMHAAEDPSTPILLRVRFLEFIGKHVSHVRDNAALKKIVTLLVKIIGAEDNTPQLLIAAVQCFPGLGPVSMLDKSWEYLSREGADILMQVMIDKDAFAEPVRQAARKALDALTESAFRSVVTKLIHWLSDDREEDEETQLRRERHLALSSLSRLTLSHSTKAQWTEEMQEYVLSLILRVLGVVDAREFAQLARVMVHLPIVNAKHGLPLLESYVAGNNLSSEKTLEAVSILGRFVQTGPRKGETSAEPVEFDLVSPLDKAGALTLGAIDGTSRQGTITARVVLLAARLAPSDGADRLLPAITNAILHLVGGDGSQLPENLSTLEALLFAAVAVAGKKSAEMLQKLNEETVQTAMAAVETSVAALEPQLLFAVKKKVRANEAGAADAEALACIHNIHVIAGAFAAKHLPMGAVKESWFGKARLPAVKRERAAGAAGMPPQPGTAAANIRTRASGAHGGDNRRRARSSSNQPQKRQRTDNSRGGQRRRR